MASFSIETRTLASKELRFKAVVFVKNKGVIIHRESKTFKKKDLARTWGKNQVATLEKFGIDNNKTCSLGELLDKFMNDRLLWDNTGRTKQYVIQMLRDCDIANIMSDLLKTSDIIEHCKNRKATGTKPVTIYHDVAYLRSVMKKAQPVFNIKANVEIFEDTIPVLIEMKLIGKSDKRTRRPTTNEIERLKEGNHMRVPLLAGSFDIVMRQEKSNALIFPYNSRSVTVGFQRVRNSSGIEDLRYHDLRREGASRLFEEGYSIEEVAQVTGHRNLNILWPVYTQLFPHKLHDKFNE